MDSWSGHKCVYRPVLATVLKVLSPFTVMQQCRGRRQPILSSAFVCQTILHGRNEMVSQYGVNTAPQRRG